MRQNTYENVQTMFTHQGGTMSTREVLDAGVHPETFYRMRDLGLLEKAARGWYRLPGLPPLAAPDLT